jgi:hypothetical protein
MGLYPTSAAINTLYLEYLPTEELSYWFYSLGRNYAYNMNEFARGAPARAKLRNYTFTGHTHEGLVIHYVPENDCLEVLAPGDGTAPGLEEFTRQAVPYSNLARISPGLGTAGTPPTDIFGPEPEHGWCYFYEKASLARQLGDWAGVVGLGDQARSKGYDPKDPSSNTPFEWLPFIEGYARGGRWQDAQDLSLAAFEKDRRIDARMCSLWDQLAKSAAQDPAARKAANTIRSKMKCPN